MNRSVRVVAFVAVFSLLLGAAGCNKLRARDQLNKGVQAFKNANYEKAIGNFQKAVALDSSLLTARLYLATAYAQQYIPGADTADNNRNAEQAIDQFKQVLAMNPPREQQVHAYKGIGSLLYNMKKFDEAKADYQQITKLDPNDPEPYYMIAVMDWAETYKTAADMKSKIGLKVDDEFKKSKDEMKTCQELQQVNGPKVQEGIDAAGQALKLRDNYDDAMAYMNLLYRRKADIECGNPEGRRSDIKTADMWSDKVLAARKEKEEKRNSQTGGITLDQQGK